MAEQAIVVTDISFGDAGKGTTVDYLVRQAKSAVVVRHNGGAQAAHNVVLPDGTHHTFAQFGSGSLVPNVRTHLSRFMVLNPINMLYEGDALARITPDIWERASVDPNALVTTPWHRAANRLREQARGGGRHGSCGLGVGETVADSLYVPELALRVRDLFAGDLAERLRALRDYKNRQLHQELDMAAVADAPDWMDFTEKLPVQAVSETYKYWLNKVGVYDTDYFANLAAQHELLVFEGAQGVLLDERYGFHPHTTWSTTTHANADALLAEIGFPGEQVRRLGVMRAYTTRHGAGPFVTEKAELAERLADAHNGFGAWQGNFRVGKLDLVAHRYALAVSPGTTELVVTHLDRLKSLSPLEACIGYQPQAGLAGVDRFFERDAFGMATAIRPHFKKDRDRQAKLTELLGSCYPVYRLAAMPDDTDTDRERKLLEMIEDELGLPITLTSSGPTWTDKRALVATQ